MNRYKMARHIQLYLFFATCCSIGRCSQDFSLSGDKVEEGMWKNRGHGEDNLWRDEMPKPWYQKPLEPGQDTVEPGQDTVVQPIPTPDQATPTPTAARVRRVPLGRPIAFKPIPDSYMHTAEDGITLEVVDNFVSPELPSRIGTTRLSHDHQQMGFFVITVRIPNLPDMTITAETGWNFGVVKNVIADKINLDPTRLSLSLEGIQGTVTLLDEMRVQNQESLVTGKNQIDIAYVCSAYKDWIPESEETANYAPKWGIGVGAVTQPIAGARIQVLPLIFEMPPPAQEPVKLLVDVSWSVGTLSRILGDLGSYEETNLRVQWQGRSLPAKKRIRKIPGLMPNSTLTVACRGAPLSLNTHPDRAEQGVSPMKSTTNQDVTSALREQGNRAPDPFRIRVRVSGAVELAEELSIEVEGFYNGYLLNDLVKLQLSKHTALARQLMKNNGYMLAYANRVIEDADTVAQLNIEPGSAIDLIFNSMEGDELWKMKERISMGLDAVPS